ncbi:DUF397 domain-containing protein [Umezawaea beigongshangensis]|uniref:DUF397 domain-containing protein n=1 Tax=Umezawaea beigongshangensis TaxID=2780383 RepID=UPI0027DEA5BC|nr:DUF397 domain-containing protein [Umezawaea beigongshangensis]
MLVNWRKSSRSVEGTNADCVEVAVTPSVVGVRDSKNPAAELAFSPVRWNAFVRVTSNRR